MKDFVPRCVADLIPVGSSGSEEQDIAATVSWLKSPKGLAEPSVREWIGFLALHYAAFRTIGPLFPLRNPGREGKKDRYCIATTAEAMLAISNQLFILQSYGVNGCLLECGCFKGYSSCCLSLACRRLGYTLVIADSFAGLPPGDDAVGTNEIYQVGDFAGARQEVEQNIRTFGDIASVEFVQGWFSDTLRGWDRPLAMLWMDVDLASSTRDVLEPCLPFVDPRGVIFSHEFTEECIREGKIVEPSGPPGTIARMIEKEDAEYRAAFLWDCLGIVGRRGSLCLQSYKLLDKLLPWLSRIGMPAASVPAAIRESAPSYEGFHEPSDTRTIKGWAWDSSQPDSPLDVAIFDGDRPLATVRADRFRQDLLGADKGNGRHGFTYPIPADLKDGRKHLIVVRIAGTDIRLLGSPRPIEPGNPG